MTQHITCETAEERAATFERQLNEARQTIKALEGCIDKWKRYCQIAWDAHEAEVNKHKEDLWNY